MKKDVEGEKKALTYRTQSHTGAHFKKKLQAESVSRRAFQTISPDDGD